jgi:hypothetical protein
VPPFCAIGKGGPEVLKQDDMKTRNLFLCYPPPHDDMAFNCLRFFQGEHVIHVGEWQGDTGDRRFERELETRFKLVTEHLLPNWGNSAYSLTVWKRKATDKQTTSSGALCTALSCFKCQKTIADAAEEGEELKRCVFCKTNVYCSSFCEESDRKAHSAEHAKRLIFFENEDELEFENDLHYVPLMVVTELDTEDTDKVAQISRSWKEITGGAANDEEDEEDDDEDDIGEYDEDEDEDEDMKDSDVNSEDDSDEDGSQDEDDEDDDDEEEETPRPVVAKKPRAEVAVRKPKQTAFAFNFDTK